MADQQFAALPWRRSGPQLEVLLISSRETRRWIIPKGWPIDGLAAHEAAAREAFEEAGVEGAIANQPAGSYDYGKKMKDGSLRACHVDVFLLEVREEHPVWPEQGERQRRWMRQPDAAAAVAEPQLAALIRDLK